MPGRGPGLSAGPVCYFGCQRRRHLGCRDTPHDGGQRRLRWGRACRGRAFDGRSRSRGAFSRGGQAGCNYGRSILGIRFEGRRGRAQRCGQTDQSRRHCAWPFRQHLRAHGDWLASARGRLGYAMNRTLLYGTGRRLPATPSHVLSSSWLPFFMPAVIAIQSRTQERLDRRRGVPKHAITAELDASGRNAAATARQRPRRFDIGNCQPAWSCCGTGLTTGGRRRRCGVGDSSASPAGRPAAVVASTDSNHLLEKPRPFCRGFFS